MGTNMLETMKERTKLWWVSLIVGVLAIAVGILSAIEPVVTLSILTIFFIVSFLISGLVDILFALSNRANLTNWGWVLVGGIVSLIFACILLALSPVGSMIIFIYYISFFIMLQAFMGIWASYRLKKLEVRDWGLFMFVAILGLILSFILIFRPDFATSFITIIFAVSLICYGFFRIFYSLRLKKMKDLFDK